MFSRNGRKKRNDESAFADRVKRVAAASRSDEAKRNPDRVAVDRRKNSSARQPAYAAAAIVLASGERLEVIVANVNEDGAEVRTNRRLVVTPVFDLIVPTLGLNRQARIVWRNANIYGLEFLN
jgi:hypothetical protein